MDELLGLSGDRSHHGRITVAEIGDPDAAGKVEKAIAIDVGDHRPFGMSCNNRRGVERSRRHMLLPGSKQFA